MADNEYQLQQFKHVNGINTDITDKIQLESKAKNMVNYDVINSVNVAEQFETERQNSLSFKIYGGIEYFSPLNNISTTYNSLTDIFSKQINASVINITNSFDIYLVKAFTGNTQLTSTKFIKKYEVIAIPSDIDLMAAAFSRNAFFEKKNIFALPEAIELYDQVDGFGKPVTDLYLYFHYKPTTETVTKKTFNSSSTETIFGTSSISVSSYNKGDVIDGELITYEKINFFEQILNPQEYFVQIQYQDVSTKFLKFKYSPFYKIKVRDFGAESIVQNISATTTVENPIPSYAVQTDTVGNYLWYDLLDFGYVDPIENIGVNFPFVNGSHYVFENIILTMQPDLTHSNTATVFNDISFNANQLINTTPINGLNNAGVIC